MWLGICEDADPSGNWAVAGLRARGMPIELIEPAELVVGARLVHRVTRTGSDVELITADGRHVAGSELRGVLNRTVAVPVADLADVEPADRDYVAQERGAALASWIAGLPCPVLNRPLPGFLHGRWYPAHRWRQLGAVVGLPPATWQLSTAAVPAAQPDEARTALVVGDEVIGASGERAAGCVALAHRAGLELAGITFAWSAGEWLVWDVSPLPDLREAGDPALRALAAALGYAG